MVDATGATFRDLDGNNWSFSSIIDIDGEFLTLSLNRDTGSEPAPQLFDYNPAGGSLQSAALVPLNPYTDYPIDL